MLTALADEPEIGRRLVTTSPDVSVSTNLGGWINKAFSAPRCSQDSAKGACCVGTRRPVDTTSSWGSAR